MNHSEHFLSCQSRANQTKKPTTQHCAADKGRARLKIQFPILNQHFVTVDIINSSSTESNEYDIAYDADLQSNEVSSLYNSAAHRTVISIALLFAIVVTFSRL